MATPATSPRRSAVARFIVRLVPSRRDVAMDLIASLCLFYLHLPSYVHIVLALVVHLGLQV